MTTARARAAALGGFALFAAMLIAIGTARSERDFGDGRSGAPFRLLPAADHAGVAPTIASTPVPEVAPARATGDASIWATPAEFAPPE